MPVDQPPIGTILLLCNLPIAKEHKAVEGAEFPCYAMTEGRRFGTRYWFTSATGEACAALESEVVFQPVKP